ncbi:MAG: glycosyltransferase [Thermoanaerobaculia bacterium]
MRTAVVHDWLNGMRGGEKVLEAMLPHLTDPTIFTLFHVPGSVSSAIERYPIRASYLNRFPLARRHYRNYLPLFPRAVEAFSLDGFDLVVSSSHCVAKGAVAPPGVPHICYCHTPVRYAYDQFETYFPEGRTPLRRAKERAVAHLRAWDVATANRPTRYLANSTAVAQRIRRHYGREALVCHPPVDVEFFVPSDAPRGDFLLAVAALVPYKKLEDAVDASRLLGRELVVVGSGPEEKRLRARAGSSVRFLRDVSGEDLRELYRTCAFFVQPGEEDFGIASVEAQACGAPIVALARGGVLDVADDASLGELYPEDGADALAAALRAAGGRRFDYTAIARSARRFARDRFDREFGKEIEKALRP